MFEMTVVLEVADSELYAQYRQEVQPLMAASGACFRFDFEVAKTIHNEAGGKLNRIFIGQFPDRATRDRFFADPVYREIKKRLLEPAVRRFLVVSESEQ